MFADKGDIGPPICDVLKIPRNSFDNRYINILLTNRVVGPALLITFLQLLHLHRGSSVSYPANLVYGVKKYY